jgi:hypothetical protein
VWARARAQILDAIDGVSVFDDKWRGRRNAHRIEPHVRQDVGHSEG